MSEQINNLYDRYLKGRLSEKDFKKFQQEVEKASDDELWQMMYENFSSTSCAVEMSPIVKDEILHLIKKKVKRERIYKMLRYVAAVLILLVSFSGVYLWLEPASKEQLLPAIVNVAPGNKATIVLPDGTKVALNSNTELQYDVVPGEHREVKLSHGEAYFEVKKDTDCPFHVSVGDMKVEVLGTRFNVKAGYDRVETSLLSGSVRLSGNRLAQKYMLIPGEKSVYRRSNHSMSIVQNDVYQDVGWKDGYLVFNSLPLKEVLKLIENWYGVTIHLMDERSANDLLTGSFHQEPLECVLSSLSMQYGFKFQIRKNEIIVR
ncbi:FecR family protein [Hoylesella oralis]|uniref:FecR family protein n=1 Tax=Hoylesella oralis TaxID=28134 RepID=UPI0036105C00